MTRFHRWLSRQPPITLLLIGLGFLVLASRFQPGDIQGVLAVAFGFFAGAANMKTELIPRLRKTANVDK